VPATTFSRPAGDRGVTQNVIGDPFEAANVRHEHEWRVWQNSKIPEQKVLMPGV
jgi:5-methyltetrahydropteroyltriglutamate--homocysteine methyltransferase